MVRQLLKPDTTENKNKQLPVVNSHNEWDTLQEVIVGRIEGAAVPPIEPALLANT